MKIGKASYGYTKKKYYKLIDGAVTFRILPPLGELADDGKWSMFYDVHYGYTNSAGKLRPFQSPLVKNYKTKMIEVPDAALERIEKLKAEMEKAKESGDTVKYNKLNELVGQKGKFNLDKNHYMNVVDLEGNIGILKLRHKAKLALDAEIKALREKGIDPLSVDDGRFFTFRRSGMGRDTTFKVEVHTETINVPNVGEVKREVKHVLTDDLIKRLSKEAADLSKLFKKPTAEEVARIVKEGPSAVDEILDTKSGEGSGSSGGEDEYENYDDEDGSDTSAASAASSPSTASNAGLTASAPVSAPVDTTPSAPVAAPTTPASTTVAGESKTAPAGTTEAKVTDMTDDEFLASLNM